MAKKSYTNINFAYESDAIGWPFVRYLQKSFIYYVLFVNLRVIDHHQFIHCLLKMHLLKYARVQYYFCGVKPTQKVFNLVQKV